MGLNEWVVAHKLHVEDAYDQRASSIFNCYVNPIRCLPRTHFLVLSLNLNFSRSTVVRTAFQKRLFYTSLYSHSRLTKQQKEVSTSNASIAFVSNQQRRWKVTKPIRITKDIAEKFCRSCNHDWFIQHQKGMDRRFIEVRLRRKHALKIVWGTT